MSLVLRLRSSSACISEVEQYVHLLFDKFGIDPELYPNILISLTEAVNNAIQHGNQNDVSKVVSVSCDKVQTVLCCEISDEGPGFDPNALPDPTAPENLEKPGGRGVFLMRQLSDRVFYKNNGSTVTLEFNL